MYLSAQQVVPPPADVSDGVEGDVVEEGEDEQPHLGRQTAHVLVALESSFDRFDHLLRCLFQQNFLPKQVQCDSGECWVVLTSI